MKNNKYVKIIPLCLGVIALFIIIGNIVLAWREPTVAPPAGNVEVRVGAMATTTGTPLTADCDEAIERGRVRIDPATNRQYLCTNVGWRFLVFAHTLSVSVTGSGTVTSSPAGIHCPTDCTEPYSANTSVTLTATPAGGWVFIGWGGACTGTGTCTVTMTADLSVTATFGHTLSVSVTGSGTVASSPAGVHCPTSCTAFYLANTSVTLTATPASNWRLREWGGACTGTGTCTVTMTSNLSVTATFEPIAYFLYDTTTLHAGDFGGRASADHSCHTNPDRPAVCSRGWAFISVNANDEVRDFPSTLSARFGHTFQASVAWYARDGAHAGVRVANNWADLLDGTIARPLMDGGINHLIYWTGSLSTGALDNTCEGWTRIQYQVTFGSIGWNDVTTGPWLGGGGSHCSVNRPLLCACY